MKSLLFTLILMMTLPLIAFSQNGQYDVRLSLNSYDCNIQQLMADIEVRASSVDSTFRMAEQNYRFSFNKNAIDSVWIMEEGIISNLITGGSGPLGFSLYSPHNLSGTRAQDVSYNMELQGGDGLFIETEWVHVGTLSFNVSEVDTLLNFKWLTKSDFPPTFISEKSGDSILALVEGRYVSDIPIGTFDDICRCPLGDITLTNQQEVNDFAVNYPDCTVLSGSLIISSNAVTDIVDMNPLSSINSVGGDLTFHNTALKSLSGLENLTSINGKLVIEDNFDLTDITAIKNIDYTTINDLRIYNNENLAVCHITSICGYFKDNDEADIDRNATGCTNDEEVMQTCALPIELISFKAYIEGKNAIIHWQTATETNNKGFEIQKSSDGIAWEKIAWQRGQGNSDTPHEYRYKDSNPFFGTSYYRLKQIDFDGKYSYSKIVEVNYAGGSISIYPNPVKKTLYISDLNDMSIKEIQIYDQAGKRIETSISNHQIDVPTLATGIYILKITTSNGVLHHNFLVE